MQLINRRMLINTNKESTNSIFPIGRITMFEFNIGNITKLSNEKDIYYPKKILTDLVPSLVKFIKHDILSYVKVIYSFGVGQDDIYQNPHNIQNIRKDIEIVVKYDTEKSVIKKLILNCINVMEDRRCVIDDEILQYGKKGVTLTVSSIELF